MKLFRNNNAVIESRSVVAQGSGQRKGTGQGHTAPYWLIQVLYITMVVGTAQLYPLLKTH